MGAALPHCCLPESLIIANAVQSEQSLAPLTPADSVVTTGKGNGEPSLVPLGAEAGQAKACGSRPNGAPLGRLKLSAPSPRTGPTNAGPSSTPRPQLSPAVDSASLLSGLDLLASPEWQTMPLEKVNPDQEALMHEIEAAQEGKPCLSLAMRALWHNCPDALEVALQRLGPFDALQPDEQKNAEFMKQKLEFTRLRQDFVAACRQFHEDGRGGAVTAATRAESLRAKGREFEARGSDLAARQPHEQESMLPGLIGRRDTIMLLARMKDVEEKLLQQAAGPGLTALPEGSPADFSNCQQGPQRV